MRDTDLNEVLEIAERVAPKEFGLVESILLDIAGMNKKDALALLGVVLTPLKAKLNELRVLGETDIEEIRHYFTKRAAPNNEMAQTQPVGKATGNVPRKTERQK